MQLHLVILNTDVMLTHSLMSNLNNLTVSQTKR